jgi:hypothetical protein
MRPQKRAKKAKKVEKMGFFRKSRKRPFSGKRGYFSQTGATFCPKGGGSSFYFGGGLVNFAEYTKEGKIPLFWGIFSSFFSHFFEKK